MDTLVKIAAQVTADLDEAYEINERIDRANGMIGYTAFLIEMAHIRQDYPNLDYYWPEVNPYYSAPTQVTEHQTNLSVERELVEAHNEMIFQSYFPGVSY